MPAIGHDRIVRVFISSTFRDMAEDRNELMAQTWPVLRGLCRQRSVEFVEIDLRWGVTEEQVNRRETIRHCLAEIERCRPYFVGLLGERYGWVPGIEAYSPAVLSEEAWLAREIAKTSVTELEIVHGVLNNPEMARRAFFYFRDPAYAAARGADYLSSSALDASLQQALKDRIRWLCERRGLPLAEGDRYRDPPSLAALVLHDLTVAIDEDFPTGHAPDPWTVEDRAHEAYARSRRTTYYVGRPAYFQRLDRHNLENGSGLGLVILGPAGGGKSALLANWLALWRSGSPNDFVFEHYVGGSPHGASHLGVMRRLMAAVDRWCHADGNPESAMAAADDEIPTRADDIVRRFPLFLDRLSERLLQTGRRALVVIDALDRLEDHAHGRRLGWLPMRLPPRVRLVVSTLHTDTFDALGSRAWPTLEVEPLTLAERAEMIARYLSVFSQGLSPERAAQISLAAATANPLFLKYLLDDLRVTAAHETLDLHLSDYLEAPDLPALLHKIFARYEREYDRDSPGLVGRALSLLWGARRGLTEAELFDALSRGEPARFPAARWSPLRYALAESLVDRDGILSFAHDLFRQAVERRYLPDAATARSVRLDLARSFAERRLDARQADELPWLLRQTQERDRLRDCLLDIDRFRLIKARDEDELRGDWLWLEAGRTLGELYRKGFERWRQRTDVRVEEIVAAAKELGSFLFNASLYPPAEVLYRFALAQGEAAFGPDDASLADGLRGLGVLLNQTDRAGEAVRLFRRALGLLEAERGFDDPAVAGCLCDLGAAAISCKETGARLEGESLLRRSLSILERRYGDDHVSLTGILGFLARLLKDRSRHAEAEACLRRSAAIIERHLGAASPKLVPAFTSLADLCHELGRFAEAGEWSQQALAIAEDHYGSESTHVAVSLLETAAVLEASRRFAQAEPLLRRALAIGEKNFGPGHYSVAIALGRLTELLWQTNRLEEAEPLARRALSINEQSHGSDHPAVAIRLCALALILRSAGHLDEAESLARRALGIDETSYGPVHSKVGATLTDLSLILLDAGKLAEAELAAQRSLSIAETLHGDTHPATLTPRHNLAAALLARRKFRPAETVLRHALAAAQPDDHSGTVARCQYRLGIALRGLGWPDEAADAFTRALAHFDSQGGDPRDIAGALMELADTVGAREPDGPAAAESHLRRALSVLEDFLGRDAEFIADCLMKLGAFLLGQNRAAEAGPPFDRAAGIYHQACGEFHPKSLDSLTGQVNVSLALSQWARAEILLRKSLSIREQIHGPDEFGTADCLFTLGKLLAITGRGPEGEPFLQRCLNAYLRLVEHGGEVSPNLPEALQQLWNVLLAIGRLQQLEPPMGRLVVSLVAWGRTNARQHLFLPSVVDGYAHLLRTLGEDIHGVAERLRALDVNVDIR